LELKDFLNNFYFVLIYIPHTNPKNAKEKEYYLEFGKNQPIIKYNPMRYSVSIGTIANYTLL
jgi:hypothetical protein